MSTHHLLNTKITGFKLIERLGTGSFGSVYRGSNGTEERAFKLIGSKADALQEATILKAMLDIEHVVPMLNFVELTDYSAIIMPVAYSTLDELRLRNKSKAFHKPTVQRIIHQMLSAIRGVHELGYLHGNIDLTNFLITPPMGARRTISVSLSDFGMARKFKDVDDNFIQFSPEDIESSMLNLNSSAYLHKGFSPSPLDDMFQMALSILVLNGDVDWMDGEMQKVTEFKKNFLNAPMCFTPCKSFWLFPFFVEIFKPYPYVPINYNSTQQVLEDSCYGNPSDSLFLINAGGEEILF